MLAKAEKAKKNGDEIHAESLGNEARKILSKHAEYVESLESPAEENLFAIYCFGLTNDCLKEHGGPDWTNAASVLRDWHGIELSPNLHRKLRALTSERSLIREERLKEKRNK